MSAEAAAAAGHSIPPPAQEVINLAFADVVIAFMFFFTSVVIAWRHGKAGMVCYPILITTFIARIVADIYQIITKDTPNIPNAVTTFTMSAVISCIPLTIIGSIYMWFVRVPVPVLADPRRPPLRNIHLTMQQD